MTLGSGPKNSITLRGCLLSAGGREGWGGGGSGGGAGVGVREGEWKRLKMLRNLSTRGKGAS